MNIRKVALSGAGAIGLVAMLGIAPAAAFTMHPATPAENAQTDQLNAQSLAAAQGNTTAPSQNAMTPTPDQSAAPAPNTTSSNTTAPNTTPTPAPNTSPSANNQNAASPEPASGIAPKTGQ